MSRFLWTLSALAAVASFLIIIATISSGGSAVQESSGFALAAAVSIIFYVLARSYDGIRRRPLVVKIIEEE